MMDLGQKMANDILSICIPYIESLSSFSCDWLKKKKKVDCLSRGRKSTLLEP